ncbi:MAG: glutathione S-transferase family protein [Moorea sp. SIO2B7]|nr:glutathione S-transferase family protein [Moorena sp. SIO2B7]
MLTFYYHPLSPIARRVWLALLEKKISFQPVLVDLRKEQYQSEFLALNPFHHVPVIVDNDLKLIESLAILDYLEYQYPSPSLSPQSARELGRMKMIQMVTTNELIPKLPLVANAAVKPLTSEVIEQINTVFQFLSNELDDHSYFGGDTLNLADIVTGATIPLFCRLGISLESYSNLESWHQRIIIREAWQKTEPNEEDLKNWQRWIQLIIKRHQRRSRPN